MRLTNEPRLRRLPIQITSSRLAHRKSPTTMGEAFSMAGPTGFEPAISSVTGRRDGPTSLRALVRTDCDLAHDFANKWQNRWRCRRRSSSRMKIRFSFVQSQKRTVAIRPCNCIKPPEVGQPMTGDDDLLYLLACRRSSVGRAAHS